MIDTTLVTGPLAERTTSGYPLSIGTGLAFESLISPTMSRYDPEREIPPLIELNEYDELWINAQTLLRNIIAALPKSSFLLAQPVEYTDALILEMDIIYVLLQAVNKPVVYYWCDYQHYRDIQHPYVKYRLSTTELQQRHDLIFMDVREMLKRHQYGIHHTDHVLNPKSRVRTLMLTHCPIDLTNWSHFNRLHLLESHTGRCKTRQEWYTKFYKLPSTDLSAIPFTKRMLFIFGDHVMFHPSLVKFRQQIVEIAQKRHWNFSTTEAKIEMDLGYDLTEPYLMMQYQALER